MLVGVGKAASPTTVGSKSVAGNGVSRGVRRGVVPLLLTAGDVPVNPVLCLFTSTSVSAYSEAMICSELRAPIFLLRDNDFLGFRAFSVMVGAVFRSDFAV